jgi:hypothetical protein
MTREKREHDIHGCSRRSNVLKKLNSLLQAIDPGFQSVNASIEMTLGKRWYIDHLHVVVRHDRRLELYRTCALGSELI